LRIPQSLIAVGINQLFGLDITRNTTNKFKSAAAQIYEHTYNELLKGLSRGRLLHIDETSISIKEGNGYVWVLTTMEEVAYFKASRRDESRKNFELPERPESTKVQSSQANSGLHVSGADLASLRHDLLVGTFVRIPGSRV
jgi:hypothetical protein